MSAAPLLFFFFFFFKDLSTSTTPTMNNQTGGIHGAEPPTTARAVLHTSRGALEIELWAKETPIASRNFLARCNEGYYDGSTFGRLIPGYIVQGGGGWRDENGTGFPDEFHTRLRFARRGVVGTANVEGARDSNGSQFVVTLAPGGAPALDRRSTVFGRVAAASLYTLADIAPPDVQMEAADGEDGDDRPLYPVRIESAEVLEPYYFDDMVIKSAAQRRREKEAAEAAAKATAAKAGATKKGTKVKQKVRVSYGGDEEEEEALPSAGKKFVMKTPALASKKKKQKTQKDTDTPEKAVPAPAPEPKESPVTSPKKPKTTTAATLEAQRDVQAETVGVSQLHATAAAPKSAAELLSEFDALKATLKKKKREHEPDESAAVDAAYKTAKIAEEEDENAVDLGKYFRSKASRRNKPKGSGSREEETLALLRAFKSRVAGPAAAATTTATAGPASWRDAEDSDEAGGDLSDEERGDPHELYAHRFEQGGSGSEQQRFGGTAVGQRDAALIAQDDTSNRRAPKYLRADPDGLLGTQRRTR